MCKPKIKNGQILIYETPKGKTQVEVVFERDNLWMNQQALSQLFQTTTQNITMHINNIYEEHELQESSTCKLDLQVQIEGNREVKREIKFYNLEMIIAQDFTHRGTNIKKSDVVIAKNNLNQEELMFLNRINVFVKLPNFDEE